MGTADHVTAFRLLLHFSPQKPRCTQVFSNAMVFSRLYHTCASPDSETLGLGPMEELLTGGVSEEF